MSHYIFSAFFKFSFLEIKSFSLHPPSDAYIRAKGSLPNPKHTTFIPSPIALLFAALNFLFSINYFSLLLRLNLTLYPSYFHICFPHPFPRLTDRQQCQPQSSFFFLFISLFSFFLLLNPAPQLGDIIVCYLTNYFVKSNQCHTSVGLRDSLRGSLSFPASTGAIKGEVSPRNTREMAWAIWCYQQHQKHLFVPDIANCQEIFITRASYCDRSLPATEQLLVDRQSLYHIAAIDWNVESESEKEKIK